MGSHEKLIPEWDAGINQKVRQIFLEVSGFLINRGWPQGRNLLGEVKQEESESTLRMEEEGRH